MQAGHVRGQLVQVGSFPPLCGPGYQTRVVRVRGRHLYPLNQPTNPKLKSDFVCTYDNS